MKWKPTPITKIYEALGSVADDRVKISGNTAKVYSSTGNKFYDISYDPDKKLIMSNDNSSYWKGYVGYPAIAYLMAINVLSYDPKLGNLLKGVPWKDINQKFKNDFEKALDFILEPLPKDDVQKLQEFVEKVDVELKNLSLGKLGKKTLPPDGY